MENELIEKNINKIIASNLAQSYVILAKDPILREPGSVQAGPKHDVYFKQRIFDVYKHFLSCLNQRE